MGKLTPNWSNSWRSTSIARSHPFPSREAHRAGWSSLRSRVFERKGSRGECPSGALTVARRAAAQRGGGGGRMETSRPSRGWDRSWRTIRGGTIRIGVVDWSGPAGWDRVFTPSVRIAPRRAAAADYVPAWFRPSTAAQGRSESVLALDAAPGPVLGGHLLRSECRCAFPGGVCAVCCQRGVCWVALVSAWRAL